MLLQHWVGGCVCGLWVVDCILELDLSLPLAPASLLASTYERSHSYTSSAHAHTVGCTYSTLGRVNAIAIATVTVVRGPCSVSTAQAGERITLVFCCCFCVVGWTPHAASPPRTLPCLLSVDHTDAQCLGMRRGESKANASGPLMSTWYDS